MEFYKFIKREGLHTNFIVNIDYSEYGKTKSFREEVKEHIKAIVSNYDSVYLLFSGGMDSRFLALNLLELGIDFTAVTYGFKEDFTDYDSQVSTEFAKKHGFKHEIFYIDVGRLQKSVDSYLDKKFFIPLLNPHYIISAINEYNKPNCVFLTGACSEFKIEYGNGCRITVCLAQLGLQKIHPQGFLRAPNWPCAWRRRARPASSVNHQVEILSVEDGEFRSF